MTQTPKSLQKAAYETPTIVTYSAGVILAQLGPALAVYCGPRDC